MGNCSHFCHTSDPEPLKSLEKINEIEREVNFQLETKETRLTFTGGLTLPKTLSETNLQLDVKATKKRKNYKNGSLYTGSEEELIEDQKSTSSHRTNDLKNLKPIKKPVLESAAAKQPNEMAKKSTDLKKKTKNQTHDPLKTKVKEISPGVIYEGNLFNGQREGQGVQKWVDGTIYEGEWKQDKANGRGKLVHRGGDLYEGEWANDKANGFGIYKNPKGGNYEGQWLNDMQHGEGKEDWPDGSHYEGEFKMGMKHGKGKIVFPDGSSYEGDFFENSIQGTGKYTWSDKKTFVGEWHQNKMHGKGEFTWENSKRYVGEFQNDRKHGLGKMIHGDGGRHYGFWKGDLKSGRGIKVDKNWSILELGEWKEGVKAKTFDLSEEKGFEVLLNTIKEDKKGGSTS